MKFINFIWDFDGTLCDSYPHTAEVFQMIMRKYNVAGAEKYDEIFLRLQITWLEAIHHFGLPAEAVAEHRTLEEDFTLGSRNPVLFPGARATLEKIKANGGKNFLYTLRNHTATDFLKNQGIGHLFEDTITYEAGFPPKPKPDAIRYLLDKHHLDPARTVMVGDRDLDGQSGINADCTGCLLTFLTRNAYGEDPLQTTAMPYACRSFAEFDALMEIPDVTGCACCYRK